MSALTGTHPLPGYPSLYQDSNNIITNKEGEFPHPPSSFLYPKSLQSILLDLLQYEPDKRLGLGEALNQLKVCCRRQSVVGRLELRRSVKEKGSTSRVEVSERYIQSCMWVVIYV